MWSSMTDRERDAVLAEAMGWTDIRYQEFQIGSDMYGLPPDGTQRAPIPGYTEDLGAARTIEDEIQKRGLIERYQNALIEILNLDMQVFNSAIELDPHGAPAIPNNVFEWEGHAYLWLFSRAAPAQRTEAAYSVLKEGSNE